jgi:hypothetical protein
VKILFGDLNFRINLPYYTVIDEIDGMTHGNKDQVMHNLLNNDQLNQCKIDFPWLYCFKELPIKFLPTYKYDKKSESYDTSKKMRVPSWTDRILWYHDEDKHGQKSKYINPILYERRETMFSDHRPVAAYFEINVHKHNVERKSSFKRKVVEKKATSFIVKKPSYDPEETKVKKEFDDFDLFSSPAKEEKPIYLDLDLGKPKKTQSDNQPSKSSHVDDLLSFDNNLIQINEKKDDGNLIDFSDSGPKQMPHAGNHFFQNRPGHGHPHFHHSHSMAPRQGPMPGVHGLGGFHPPPMHPPHPMQFHTATNVNRNRASVPRKPSADLIDRPQSNNIPKKKAMDTQDYFQF